LLLTLSFSAVFGLKLSAQDDIQRFQEEWGKDKKELVRIGMGLSAADSVKFWPIYAVYEKERQKLGRERITILGEYADNYYNISNAKTDELINRIFKNEAAFAKLQQQYYGKVKAAITAIQAAKFMHIESYLHTTIRAELLGELPVIGELDKMKTAS
jgi:hypothetical protein